MKLLSICGSEIQAAAPDKSEMIGLNISAATGNVAKMRRDAGIRVSALSFCQQLLVNAQCLRRGGADA